MAEERRTLAHDLLGPALGRDNMEPVKITLREQEYTIDLYQVSIAEWRSIFKKGQKQKEEDKIVGKILGISADEVANLPQPVYRRLMKKIFDVAAKPLDDPNSQSASTEDSQDKETESQPSSTDGD